MTSIIITGTPAWAAVVYHTLTPPYTVETYTVRDGYVGRLVDTHAALILVDGSAADWQFWTTTPKSSAATRRIPIFCISDDAQTRHQALLSGADISLSTDEFRVDIAQWVTDYARTPDPALVEQLACECLDALPALAAEGVEKFNQRAYYTQHDLFEAQWAATQTPVRDLYRAILQVGIAYYQIERGNYRGALKMFLRSVQWLALLPDVCQGIDVQQLREDSYRARAALQQLGESNLHQFDHSLLKPLKQVTT